MEKFEFKNESDIEEELNETFSIESAHDSSRDRKIEQREKHKYYHVSKKHYHPGDVIESYLAKDKEGDVFRPTRAVYLTDSPAPHVTVLHERDDIREYIVYRVIPLGKVKHGSMHEELTANKVKVVQIIGHAGGFKEREQSSAVIARRFVPPTQSSNDVAVFIKNKPNESLREDIDRKQKGKNLLNKIEKKYGKS